MISKFLARYPLLGPTLGLAIGIYLASVTPWVGKTLGFIPMLWGLSLLGVFFFRRFFLLRFLFLALFFFGLGWFRIGDYFFRALTPPLAHWVEAKESPHLLLELVDFCQSDSRRSRWNAKVLGYFEGENFLPLKFGMRVTVGEAQCSFSPGMVLRGPIRLGYPKSFWNPNSFDFPRYLRGQGILVTGYLALNQGLTVVKGGGFFDQWVYRVRQFFLQGVHAAAPFPEARGILEAIGLGEESSLTPEVQTAFRHTGLTHVLVVSGLHLTLLLLVFYYPLYLVFSLYRPWAENGWARNLAMSFALVPTFFYASLVGFTPSVLRSLVMAFAVVLTLVTRWRRHFPSVLLLTLLFLLTMSPRILFDLGFQLSFLSVGAIYFFGKSFQGALQILSERIPFLKIKILNWSLMVFFSSTAVNIALYPLLANTFHEFSLIAPLANLLFVPYFAFFLLPAELFMVLLSWILPAWGHSGFTFLAWLTEKVFLLLRFFAQWKFSSTLVPPLGGWDLLAYFFLLLLLFHLSKLRRILIFGILGCTVFFLPRLYTHFHPTPPTMTLTMVDVGQGESLLLKLPNGEVMVVDGGGIPYSDFDIGKNVVAPELLARRIFSLFHIFLTHPDADHMKGLFFLVENFKAQRFHLSPGISSHQDFISLKEVLEKSHIPLTPLGKGAKMEWGGAQFEVLWPPEGEEIGGGGDNNQSLVLRVCYREVCFLLTGDIEGEVEDFLARSSQDLSSAVLKVAHHGSRTSTSTEFLKKVQPKIALISMGRENRFHFPHPEVLNHLNKAGVQVLRTDEMGEIEVVTDGHRLFYQTFTNEPIPNWWFASHRVPFE